MALNTIIATNMMALTNMRNLALQGNKQNKANKRIASGKKLNSATDDAAGLAISKKMRAQIVGLEMASKNVDDTISLLDTAEGSLTEVNNILTRVRELTVQASNDTNTKDDRIKLAQEVALLLTEIDTVSSNTEFNQRKLNNGTFEDVFFQIGANTNQSLGVSLDNSFVSNMGLENLTDVFGIENKVPVSPTGIVTGEEKTTQMITGKFFLNAHPAFNLRSFRVTINATINGEAKTFLIPKDAFDPKNHTSTFGGGIKFGGKNLINGNALQDTDTIFNLFVTSLKEHPEFKELSQYFDIQTTPDRRLNIVAKNPGGDALLGSDPKNSADITVEFKYGGFTWADGTCSATQKLSIGATNPNDYTDGQYVSIDTSEFKDGETVTICGQEFKKVSSSKNNNDNSNTFSSATELSEKLKSFGLYADVKDSELILRKIEDESQLAFTYVVNSKNVSDKGKDFSQAIECLDKALNTINEKRANLGSFTNRLIWTKSGLNVSSENLTSAMSVLNDADISKEMMNLTSSNILQQAATSLLAQANQKPKDVLSLLN